MFHRERKPIGVVTVRKQLVGNHSLSSRSELTPGRRNAIELPVLFPGWSGPSMPPAYLYVHLTHKHPSPQGTGWGDTEGQGAWRGMGKSTGDHQQLASLTSLPQASRFPGAGVSLIKNRLSGRAHQLPGDLRDCLMSSNTMSVTTFALSAPLEDGAYSKEENIFKIEADLLGPPLAFPATSRIWLEAWRWLFSFSS